jgi:hypothetical protein
MIVRLGLTVASAIDRIRLTVVFCGPHTAESYDFLAEGDFCAGTRRR